MSHDQQAGWPAPPPPISVPPPQMGHDPYTSPPPPHVGPPPFGPVPPEALRAGYVPAPPPFPPDPGLPPARRGRLLLVLGAVLVLMLAAATAVAVLAWPDDEPTGQVGAGATTAPAGDTTAGPTGSPSASGPPSVIIDDFDGAELDRTRWNAYESTSPNGSRWSPSAIQVGGGSMRIVGTGRNPGGAGNVSGGMCWCGRYGDQVQGTWQVRARFTAGAGYGQIITLWPQSDRAADGYATFASTPAPDKKQMHGTLTWPGGKVTRTVKGSFTDWHTYKVEWTATALRMSVDDAVFLDTTGVSGAVLPKQPLHLVIQQMAGPNGDVPGANASTPDQVVLEVDWVRYERP